MSTVTLSQPHCAMVSAEQPLGIASHPLTQALPACSRLFSIFVDIRAFPFPRVVEDGGIISPPAKGRPWRCVAERSDGSSALHGAGRKALDDVFLQQCDQDHSRGERQQ